MTDDGHGHDDVDSGEDERSPFALVAQFFIIPLGVVILAVAIFMLFGLFTREKHTPGEYLDEVVAGSKTRRWQAAYEFATTLGTNPELTDDEALFQKTMRVFENTEEPEVRRYLALALGRFSRPEAVSALTSALDGEDEETRLYAALALSSIRDPAAVEPLLGLLRAEEPPLRKAAAFALGHIGDPRALEPLKATSEDRLFDVALQGAVALAQLGDGHGVAVLRRALDPATFAEVEAASPDRKMEPAQRSEARINAIRGLILLRDEPSRTALQAIAASDDDLRVRDAALRALDEIGKPASAER